LLAGLGGRAGGDPGLRAGVRNRLRGGRRPHAGNALLGATARRPGSQQAFGVTADPGSQARPEIYSRGAWLFMRALDPLPWPWGEEILAKLFAAKAFIRPRLLRKAVAWAGHYPLAGRSRWR